jgi:predicted metal-dependent enzyme (double-stranded beta helix superfamily)
MADDPTADAWPWPEALDALQAAPDHHKVLLENDHVRVLEAWVGPGDTVPVHSHRWPSVVQIVSCSEFVRFNPDGEAVLDSRTAGRQPRPGTIVWGPPLAPHSLTNVGTQELRAIVVELKRS